MRAGEISSLIDVSYQLIGHRTSKLRDLGLVDKHSSIEDGKMRSAITDKAVNIYFSSGEQIQR
jgi:DNA-binding transcriptional ArsR family regulator